MADVKTLLPLQEIDLRLFRLRRERARKPEELRQMQEAVRRAEARAGECLEKLKGIKVDRHRLEVDLNEKDEKIKKLEQDALRVKRNEEYLAIKKQISGIRADQSLITDRWLEIEARVEQGEREHREAQQELNEAKARLAEEEKRIQREIQELDARITSAEKERVERAGAVEEELLQIYERIVRSEDKEGRALAPVIRARPAWARKKKKEAQTPGEIDLSSTTYTCGGCQCALTAQDINLLLMGREVQLCRNCSRILYVETQDVPSAS